MFESLKKQTCNYNNYNNKIKVATTEKAYLRCHTSREKQKLITNEQPADGYKMKSVQNKTNIQKRQTKRWANGYCDKFLYQEKKIYYNLNMAVEVTKKA